MIRWKTQIGHNISDTSGVDRLNLAEVQVFLGDGAQIPPAQLNFTLSSTYMYKNVSLSASNCNNGNTSGVYPDVCHTADFDANPSLTVSLPCPTGYIWSSISKVLVYNRAPTTCCSVPDRIQNFKLDMINNDNTTAFTFPFTATQALYTFTPGKLSSRASFLYGAISEQHSYERLVAQI
jgi:hypothetical protein